MIYYIVLIAASFHLFALYHRWREEKSALEENDRVLMGIAFAVGISLPFLGWFRMSWIATTLLLLTSATLWYYRQKLPAAIQKRLKYWSVRCRGWAPVPSLAIAIVGLFCWGWYW